MYVVSHFNTRHTCHTHALAALLAISRPQDESADKKQPPKIFSISRKINFLIWDQIWPALGYVQAIGVLGMQFWALFGISHFYLFRQVWSLTNLWPCSNFGFPRSIFFFLAPKHPPWWVEHGCVKWSRVPPVCSPIPGPWCSTAIILRTSQNTWRE